MIKKPALIMIFLNLFIFSQLAFSLPEKKSDTSKSEKTLRIPRLSQKPQIDGKLDNPIWEKEALKVEDFLQFSPKEKAPPSEKTVAYIGYDSKNLYFAFRCYDSDPQKIRATITNRDNIMEDDWVVIFLDAYNEKRRAFTFFLNPFGVQMDTIRTEKGGSDHMDPSWDAVFYSDGTIDEKGYTVEMALPFKSFRFPDKQKKNFGLVIGRTIARKGEIVLWPEASRNIPGLLTQGGEMIIDGEVQKGRNFELMPVVTSLKTKGEKITPQAGMNFKWGINSNMTMDLTLNPDFSHIEADAPQIDVNQRFALYYPEKRPFFLEGMEIFQFPEIEMVYTRRIIDPIGGAKLTGKTGAFTYGMLSAYDMNPTESLWEVHNGGHTGQKALFNIFRMKADVFKESYVGFALADKEIDGSYNRVAGVDGQFKFNQHFFFNFQAIGSKTKYEQEESGIAPAFYSEFSYYSRHWGGGLYWKSIHPEFRASSGYVNRVDYKTIGSYTSFQLYPEKQYLNQVRFTLRGGRRYAYFENTVLDDWVSGHLHLRVTEFSMINASLQKAMERFGGVDFHKNSFNLNGNLSLIRWLPLGFHLGGGDRIFYNPDSPFLGWSHSYGLFFTLKPNKRLQMRVMFNKETFWKERGGKQLYDYNVIRQRTTYQLTKTLSFRAIVDYNHYYKKIYGSFLFSYILKPGTVFFLGVDNKLLQQEMGHYTQEDYSVFLKFSYWWRM
ncbi:carbohydrate binding family 9 domain-containing protein [bacterium]|nr:carbohydrate binding family 9 domain-containing protein [bacterium]